MEFKSLITNCANEVNDYFINNPEDKINLYDFIFEYIKDNPDEDLIQSGSDYDDEKIDSITREVIEQVKIYLETIFEEKYDINKRFECQLKKTEKKINAEEAAEPVVTDINEILSEEEINLLTKNGNEIIKDDVELLNIIYEKLKNSINDDYIAKCLVQIAQSYEMDSSVDNISKANKWENAARSCEVSLPKIACECYRKCAARYSIEHDHNEAASLYKKAYELTDQFESEYELKIGLIRNSRKEYELSGNSDEESQVYIMENELALQNSDGIERSILFCLKWLSNYGESPLYVAGWAILVILISAIIYYWFGIYSSHLESVIYDFPKSLYYSVVTFTTLGYGDFSPFGTYTRIFSAIEAVSGLLLTSFFLVSIYRKYTR